MELQIKQVRENETNKVKGMLFCFLKEFIPLKLTFPVLQSKLYSAGNKKKKNRFFSKALWQSYEMIFGLTFPAAKPDEKEIEVKVNTPTLPSLRI